MFQEVLATGGNEPCFNLHSTPTAVQGSHPAHIRGTKSDGTNWSHQRRTQQHKQRHSTACGAKHGAPTKLESEATVPAGAFFHRIITAFRPCRENQHPAKWMRPFVVLASCRRVRSAPHCPPQANQPTKQHLWCFEPPTSTTSFSSTSCNTVRIPGT